VNTFVLVLTSKPEHALEVEHRVIDSCSATTKKQATRILLRRNAQHPPIALSISFYNQPTAPANGILVTKTPSGAVRQL
jgi:hypothetical protein